MSASFQLRAALCASMFLLFAVWGNPADAAKRLPEAKAHDCIACHGAEKVLPAKHKKFSENTTLAECRECHEPGTDESLSGQFPMSHTHMLAGKGCNACHGDGKPAPIDIARCTSCHDPEKIAAKSATLVAAATGGKGHQNPHKSPHYGLELECTNCHVAHAKSEDFCASCHSFGFKVP